MDSLKVTLIGAAGGIGQTLALLLKMNPNITELALYDIVHSLGVGCDVSHVCTPTKVTSFIGKDQTSKALTGANIVVIVAGVPRKPGMTRDDLFNINAKIVKEIAEVSAVSCPNAVFLIVSNPVNSTVPIFAEVLKKYNVYNPSKVMGVTSLDIVRSNTFVAEKLGRDVRSINVPVIGGHGITTILPLLSHVPDAQFTPEDITQLTNHIRYAGDEVVNAKDGAGSATLSMAYAANYLTSRVVAAMRGEADVVECVFCENNLSTSPFFATPVRFGKDGIAEVLHYGSLSEAEDKMLKEMMTDLVYQVDKGVQFVAAPPAPAPAPAAP